MSVLGVDHSPRVVSSDGRRHRSAREKKEASARRREIEENAERQIVRHIDADLNEPTRRKPQLRCNVERELEPGRFVATAAGELIAMRGGLTWKQIDWIWSD